MKLKKTLMLLVLITFMLSATHGQQEQGKFTNHGPQLTASMIQGSIFVTTTDGTEMIYTVVRGEPAHLLGYDVKTKALKLDKPLGDADGVWDMAQASDGALYIPGASGSLFKHIPGTQEIEDLGIALTGETYLWNLTAGKDGEVFGATYPGCRVFRYHPKDGFSDVGKGPLVEGENYVRSLAFHQKTGLLYAGVGSHAHLIEINPKTGTKQALLPKNFQEKEFVYSLEIVPGKNGNDRLFALLTSGSLTLIYNLKTKKFEQEVEGMDMKAIIANPKSKQVFYTGQSNLMQFNPSKSIALKKIIAEKTGSANAFSWGKDKNLYLLNSAGELVQYNPKTKNTSVAQLEIPGQPIPINAIMAAPDGKIWTGGYLAGGHATFNPQTGINEKHVGLDQTEGMAVQGDSIYFGIYPKGRFYVYNTHKPWDIKQYNPKKIAQIEEQSRSFAVLSTSKQMMVFGMIPEYGKLGGALVTYDIAKNQTQTYQPIKDQAIASLVQSNETVIAGTTISGGLGIKPSQKEAVLFGWNLANAKKTFEITPVPGATAITSLIKGPDGNVWGIADGVLFIFDAMQQKVLSTNKLYDYPPFKSHVWRSAFLVLHPNGQVYGTDNNQLFKIDPITKACTLIAEDAALLTMDKKGILYFKRKTNLWSYQP
ncbi:hypothetical protein [Pedobacter alpinus]|uniref:Uncharacterized protein n=1 Tax=Pedobacter alpinus TaxID=1590643 RepID=A0ABW5TUP6_9SPHI